MSQRIGGGRGSFFAALLLVLIALWLPSASARQTSPSLAREDPTRLLFVRGDDGTEHAVRNADDWARRRAHILANLQRVMGHLPDDSRRVPLDVKVLEEVRTPAYVRRKISYAPEAGDRVPAYLLIPNGLKRAAPAMLCLHQTTALGKDEPVGLGGRPSLHYAHELALRGYVCLVPDYPSLGEYRYDLTRTDDVYVSGSMKAIWNNLRAVDLLESLTEVDRRRIGCIGHSLGGHNALFTALFDRRLRAVITSCGFSNFHDDTVANWTGPRYMPRLRDVYGNDPQKIPFDFHELIAAIAPRALFVCAPLHDSNFKVQGVRHVVDSARKVYELLGAGQRLKVVYPDAPHDFPDEVRRQAYEWLGRQLR